MIGIKMFLTMLVSASTGIVFAMPELPQGFDDRGIFSCGQLEIAPAVYESNWARLTTRELKGTFLRKPGKLEVSGRLPLKFSDSSVDFFACFQASDEEKVACTYRFEAASLVELKEIALSINLPANFYAGKKLLVDSRELELPEQHGQVRLGAFQATTLKIPTETGFLLLHGKLDLLVQDDRKWNVNNFSVRVRFSPSVGPLTVSRLRLDLEFQQFKTEPIDLRAAAFTGFRDDAVGDRKGGWTDQGDNDLRMMKPGKMTLGGVHFDIIDPDRNGGNSCMVFRAFERDYFRESATIAGGGRKFRALYLLHALAWAPRDACVIGTLEVAFDDGSRETIEVKAPEDLGDWYTPNNRPNGRVVWTGMNRQAYVGLYLSKYPVPERPIRSIRFKTSGRAVWMVVALSGGDNIPLPELTRSFIVQNEHWVPIHNSFHIQPDSILDFSRVTPKYDPAQFGRLKISGGHFESTKFPGRPIRFYDVNIMHFDDVLHGKKVKELVDYIAAVGYNAVRLHHYDHIVADYSHPASPRVDEKKMQRLDFLFSELKKRGMYLSIDLFSLRKIRRGAIAELDRDVTQNEYKALIPVSESARRNFEEFARSVLEHRNEYTGLRWKEDPALFSLCTVNEDNIHSFYAFATPEVKELYRREFVRNGKGMTFSRFLTELGIRSHRRNVEFLRSLGCMLPVTAVNANLYDASFGEIQTLREKNDYVDNHSYHDHGKYQQDTQRWSIDNRSAITAEAAVPRDVMPSRIWGKPFLVTEFDFCSPNHFRSEAGAIFGGYAALQGWDGVFRFCLSYRPDQEIRHFGLAGDPINMLSEKIGLLNFLRGDVRPAEKKFALRFDSSTEIPEDFSRLGLYAQIGSLGRSAPLPAGVEEVPQNWAAEPKQLMLSPESGCFRQVTDLSECLISPEGGNLIGAKTSVRFIDGRSTFYIASMDGQRLEKSRRLLLLLLTDVQNSQTVFADQHHNLMLSGGRLPLLVRAGSAEVTLQRSDDASLKLYAVALDGSRLAELPVVRQGNDLRFTLKTVYALRKEPALAFELSE